MVQQYTDKTNIKEGKVTIKFYATWCGPCRALSPRFEELSKQYPDVTFIEADVDEYTDLASDFNIRSVPVVVTLKDGEVKDRVVGNTTSEEYIKALKALNE